MWYYTGAVDQTWDLFCFFSFALAAPSSMFLVLVLSSASIFWCHNSPGVFGVALTAVMVCPMEISVSVAALAAILLHAVVISFVSCNLMWDNDVPPNYPCYNNKDFVHSVMFPSVRHVPSWARTLPLILDAGRWRWHLASYGDDVSIVAMFHERQQDSDNSIAL